MCEWSITREDGLARSHIDKKELPGPEMWSWERLRKVGVWKATLNEYQKVPGGGPRDAERSRPRCLEGK